MICGTTLNGTTGMSVTSSTAKTAFTITAPTNQRVKLRAMRFYTNGTSGTDAQIHVIVQWVTSDGTATTVTAADIGRFRNESETPQATIKHTYTVQPTLGDTVMQTGFHPQSTLPESFPPGGEIVIPGGDILAITINSPSAKTIYGYIEWEE